jgi:hypothetical protein
MAEGEGFDVLKTLILKDLAYFRYSQTARSGQKPGSRNEIGTVNFVSSARSPAASLSALRLLSERYGIFRCHQAAGVASSLRGATLCVAPAWQYPHVVYHLADEKYANSKPPIPASARAATSCTRNR